MNDAHIDKFYQEFKSLEAFLIERGELSFAVEVGSNFRRSLILAVASYFEHEICEILRAMSEAYAPGNPMIASLIEKKVITRQYHTYFDWDNLSANSFFGMFGENCKSKFQARNKDPDFKVSVVSFLEIGQMRNKIVHNNFVRFDVDKTPDDVFSLYMKALPFIDYMRRELLSD